MAPPQEITKDQLLSNYDTFLFVSFFLNPRNLNSFKDADGVLWRGEVVVEGAVDALSHLISIGKRVIIISNNATMTPAQFAQKVSYLSLIPNFCRFSDPKNGI
jgi:ribonucleotide monophosphatase NagD (HAD superfamily)